jgi:hypothetical protein
MPPPTPPPDLMKNTLQKTCFECTKSHLRCVFSSPSHQVKCNQCDKMNLPCLFHYPVSFIEPNFLPICSYSLLIILFSLLPPEQGRRNDLLYLKRHDKSPKNYGPPFFIVRVSIKCNHIKEATREVEDASNRTNPALTCQGHVPKKNRTE